MTVKEFADIFDMSVAELAKFTGYERRTLYYIFDQGGANKKRLEATCRLLISKANIQMKREKAEAEKRYNAKLAAVDWLYGEKI